MINTPCSRQKNNIKGPNEQLFVTLERERQISFQIGSKSFLKTLKQHLHRCREIPAVSCYTQFLMANNVICSFACPSVSRAEILDKSHYLKFLKFFMHQILDISYFSFKKEYTCTVKLVESRCCAFQHVVQSSEIIQFLDIFLSFYVYKMLCNLDLVYSVNPPC